MRDRLGCAKYDESEGEFRDRIFIWQEIIALLILERIFPVVLMGEISR